MKMSCQPTKLYVLSQTTYLYLFNSVRYFECSNEQQKFSFDEQKQFFTSIQHSKQFNQLLPCFTLFPVGQFLAGKKKKKSFFGSVLVPTVLVLCAVEKRP